MMRFMKFISFVVLRQVLAFAPYDAKCGFREAIIEKTRLKMANGKVGIFFGTSTGNTEAVAFTLASELGNDVAAGPFEIESLKGNIQNKFDEYDCFLVGTPTWNTGADTERSGTGWDEIYYNEMQNLNIKGKKVAVFGLGDSASYGENYADASGELHDVFESLGCKMYGYTSQEGYDHEESKAIRGDKFCGLLLDAINQEDLTEGRVKDWVSQLKQEGFMEGVSPIHSTVPVLESDHTATSSLSPSSVPDLNDFKRIMIELEELEKENTKLRQMLGQNSDFKEESSNRDENGFMPHFNSKSGSTMWVSPDGRMCYYTSSSGLSSTFKP